MTGYDFKDHSVQNMVMSEHRPTERWETVQGSYEPGSNVVCQADGASWPCPSVLALRDFETEQRKAHHQRLAEQAEHQDGLSPW